MHSLIFYDTVLRLLTVPVQSEWISDELLDRFVTNFLNLLGLLSNPNIYLSEDYRVFTWSQLGDVFKSRLAT